MVCRTCLELKKTFRPELPSYSKPSWALGSHDLFLSMISSSSEEKKYLAFLSKAPSMPVRSLHL